MSTWDLFLDEVEIEVEGRKIHGEKYEVTVTTITPPDPDAIEIDRVFIVGNKVKIDITATLSPGVLKDLEERIFAEEFDDDQN